MNGRMDTIDASPDIKRQAQRLRLGLQASDTTSALVGFVSTSSALLLWLSSAPTSTIVARAISGPVFAAPLLYSAHGVRRSLIASSLSAEATKAGTTALASCSLVSSVLTGVFWIRFRRRGRVLLPALHYGSLALANALNALFCGSIVSANFGERTAEQTLPAVQTE